MAIGMQKSGMKYTGSDHYNGHQNNGEKDQVFDPCAFTFCQFNYLGKPLTIITIVLAKANREQSMRNTGKSLPIQASIFMPPQTPKPRITII